MYRVLLIDDQSLFRDMARDVFDAAGGFEVAGEGADGSEAAGLYRTLAPDVVLMDVQMPLGMNGFEATRTLTSASPDACIVLTSMARDPEYPRLAREAGAAAFMSKRDLDVQAIRAMLDERGSRTARQAA